MTLYQKHTVNWAFENIYKNWINKFRFLLDKLHCQPQQCYISSVTFSHLFVSLNAIKQRAHIICERVDKRLHAAASLNRQLGEPTHFVVAASDVRRVKTCKCAKSLHYSWPTFRKDKVHFHIPARWRASWEILYQWAIKWEQIHCDFRFSQGLVCVSAIFGLKSGAFEWNNKRWSYNWYGLLYFTFSFRFFFNFLILFKGKLFSFHTFQSIGPDV